jgi:hypothetical protein
VYGSTAFLQDIQRVSHGDRIHRATGFSKLIFPATGGALFVLHFIPEIGYYSRDFPAVRHSRCEANDGASR